MSKTNKCGPGQIERSGYHRKKYRRRSYSRGNKLIPSAIVAETYVEPVCIKDVGKPGIRSKTLPKLNDIIHLSKYGYGVHKSESQRHLALRAASSDNNPLLVLHRLNLIRNYQAIPENKEIFSEDVEYMKKLYAKSKNQKGGRKIESVMTTKEICHDDKCEESDTVREIHTTTDKIVAYSTLSEDDIEQIQNFNQTFFNNNLSKSDIEDMLKENPMIGIEINGILEGYCQYKLSESVAIITQFAANKGYGKNLYLFMERYFKHRDCSRILTTINRANHDYQAGDQIEFWEKVDFHTVKSNDKSISMEKKLK